MLLMEGDIRRHQGPLPPPPPLTGGAKNVCMTEVYDGNALHGAAQHVRRALFLPLPPLHICLVIQSFCRKILRVHSAERISCF